MNFTKKSPFLLLIPALFLMVSCAGFNEPSRTETLRQQEATNAEIKALQQQNATLAKQLESIQGSLQSLNAKIDLLTKRLEATKKKAHTYKKISTYEHKKKRAMPRHVKTVHHTSHPSKISNPKKTPPQGAKPKPGIPPLKLYHEAYKKYASHKFHEAADMFLEFVRLYPKHPYANNALYWTGESYYSLGDYKKAAYYFKEVIEKYPKGSKVPDALLKLGYTYDELGDKKAARDYLFKLMDQFPFSEAAQKAQAKLDELY